MRDLIPLGRSRRPSRLDKQYNETSLSPFFTLRREMDRLFDDAFAGFGLSSFGQSLNWPTIEVVDREKEVLVTAELPGLEEEDVELHVEDGVLTLRGEKHTEVEESDRRYTERAYGRFERRIALPTEVDEDRASATFRNGVITVTLPKTEQARKQTKRIPISH